MTILQLLEKMVGPAAGLLNLLERAKESAPDLAPQIDDWIIKLTSAASAGNLVALATELPKEIANVAAGRIDPRNHPSDAA